MKQKLAERSFRECVNLLYWKNRLDFFSDHVSYDYMSVKQKRKTLVNNTTLAHCSSKDCH